MQRQALQSPIHPSTHSVSDCGILALGEFRADIPSGHVYVPLPCGQTILANKIQQVKTITELLALGGSQGSFVL